MVGVTRAAEWEPLRRTGGQTWMDAGARETEEEEVEEGAAVVAQVGVEEERTEMVGAEEERTEMKMERQAEGREADVEGETKEGVEQRWEKEEQRRVKEEQRREKEEQRWEEEEQRW